MGSHSLVRGVHAVVAVEHPKGRVVLDLGATEVSHHVLLDHGQLGLVARRLEVDEEVEGASSRVLEVDVNVLQQRVRTKRVTWLVRSKSKSN